MDSRWRRLSAAIVSLLLLNLSLSATSQTTTNILLNCGGSAAASPPDDSRSFLPDSSSSASLSGDSSVLLSPQNSPPSLYTTARISSSSFSYDLSLSSAGDFFLRLHFFPFSNLPAARFSVSAAGTRLLDPGFPSTNIIHEFLLRSSGGRITVTFTAAPPAVAFVSALELFTAPPPLFSTSNVPSQSFLQTLYRVNAGGGLVTPATDSLSRRWIPDAEFLVDAILSQTANTSTAIDYAGIELSPDIAPASVYNTLREMRRRVPDPQINITWRFNVPAAENFLVRMHFCDFVSSGASDLVFNTYVNRRVFIRDLRPWDLVEGRPVAPFYRELEVAGGSSPEILITVGRSLTASPAAANAILNGLEIFRIVGGTSGGGGGGKSNVGVIAGAAAGGVVVFLVLAVSVFLFVRRRRIQKERLQSEVKDNEMSWWSALPGNSTVSGVSSGGAAASVASRQPMNIGLIIALDEILLATDNFDDKLIVGSGGFGNVYRGILRDGTRVAVKRATPGSSQGYPEFQAEVLLLSKIRHKHLVSLVGYCDEQGQMILVYEFMEKGTLKSLLHGGDAAAPPWKQRLEICIGAARGIHYLHTGDAQAIIHRDLKTSNILLDGDLVAKVSDFGLSRSGPAVGRTHVSTAVKGSFGYMDPEYFRTQMLTDKSDVYSFGVVLLEVLCARKVIDPDLPVDQVNLADWALIKHRRGQIEEIIDPRLKSEAAISTASLKKFAETAIRCLEPYGDDRPAIGDVLWNLEYCLQLQKSSETRRDPFDDSGVVETQFPVAMPLRRVPSIGEDEDDDATLMAGNELDFTASKAFSQLVTREGR